MLGCETRGRTGFSREGAEVVFHLVCSGMLGRCLECAFELGPQVFPFTPSAGTLEIDCSAFDISVRDGVKLILWRKSEGPLIIELEAVDGSFLSNRFRNFPFLFLGVGVVT